MLAALTDDKVRDLALRAAGLSDRSLRAIADMVDSARAVEGLPASAPGDDTSGRPGHHEEPQRPGRDLGPLS